MLNGQSHHPHYFFLHSGFYFYTEAESVETKISMTMFFDEIHPNQISLLVIHPIVQLLCLTIWLCIFSNVKITSVCIKIHLLMRIVFIMGV